MSRSGLFLALLAFGLVSACHSGKAAAQDNHPKPTPLAAAMRDPQLEKDVLRVGAGLTDIREAATTGDPGMLREAEREILSSLLDALDESLVGDRPDPARYARVLAAYNQVSGMFKEIPYTLEVQPGNGLQDFTLKLRRPPQGAIASRKPPLRWHAEEIPGGIRLTPPVK
jgi:hypothetical protein